MLAAGTEESFQGLSHGTASSEGLGLGSGSGASNGLMGPPGATPSQGGISEAKSDGSAEGRGEASDPTALCM